MVSFHSIENPERLTVTLLGKKKKNLFKEKITATFTQAHLPIYGTTGKKYETQIIGSRAGQSNQEYVVHSQESEHNDRQAHHRNTVDCQCHPLQDKFHLLPR